MEFVSFGEDKGMGGFSLPHANSNCLQMHRTGECIQHFMGYDEYSSNIYHLILCSQSQTAIMLNIHSI